MCALYDIFKRNFPFCVREESYVRELFSGDSVTVISERDSNNTLIGAAVVEENNILMLCVDAAWRRQGIGSRLLAAAEKLIRENGYTSVTAGAGRHYLMPGIPVPTPVVQESLQPDHVYNGLDSASAAFFCKRGYSHSWDCNCFDMRLDLEEFHAVPFRPADITFRWAKPEDMENAVACTDDAHESFSKYYKNPEHYTANGRQRVFLAECSCQIAGTLIVSFASEGPGLGSVGCTAVRHTFRGRKIASDLVILGTQKLKEAGLEKAFLGYTYTGLDKLYGYAGYRICVYYYMAEKKLQ